MGNRGTQHETSPQVQRSAELPSTDYNPIPVDGLECEQAIVGVDAAASKVLGSHGKGLDKALDIALEHGKLRMTAVALKTNAEFNALTALGLEIRIGNRLVASQKIGEAYVDVVVRRRAEAFAILAGGRDRVGEGIDSAQLCRDLGVLVVLGRRRSRITAQIDIVRMGAGVIKCATTGGASSRPGHGPYDREFTRQEIQALVEESHNLGRRVMCHALGGPGLRLALEAGVDSIEHGTYLNEDPDLIPMMVEKGIFYVPTLLVYVYHRENVLDHVKSRAQNLYSHHLDSIRNSLDAGVKVVAGTDAGGWGHPVNAGELQCMVEEAGMTPMQALVAATGTAAQCLGQEKELGTVEKGKLADLVVVDGDPLQDIKVLLDKERIKMVIKGGHVYADRT